MKLWAKFVAFLLKTYIDLYYERAGENPPTPFNKSFRLVYLPVEFFLQCNIGQPTTFSLF